MVFRYRHLMINVVSLLPHCKKDNKVESKESKGATLNELVELKSCSSCMFFEVSASKCFVSLVFSGEIRSFIYDCSCTALRMSFKVKNSFVGL